MLEEGYLVQYLYNAISEYLYISITLIENYGPQNVNELTKFTIFFKKELNSFLEIFQGETKAEKIINLLSSVTTAFSFQEEIVSLSKTYEKCKRTLFQELIQSNVADIILRGISSIKEICKCINLNIAIHIKEDMLLYILRQSSLFQIEDGTSVTILEFTGLIGYNDNLYKTITDYFQSYLLKVSSFTYEEINLHDSFIHSCGIKSTLVILCVFYIDEMFKCKNNYVKVRKTWKSRSKNESKVQIDQLSKNWKDTTSVSDMVFNLCGFTIKNFKGEIIRVNKTMGYIHGILEIHCYVGVFPVFFNMSALKFVCGTDNLVDFISPGDSVEFDAEYCNKTRIEDRYWKASLVKVTRKSSLRMNKYQVNFETEEYTERRLMKEKFNGVRKSDKYCINNSNGSKFCDASNITYEIENLHPDKETNTLISKPDETLDSTHGHQPSDATVNSFTELSAVASNEENIKDGLNQIFNKHDVNKNILSQDIHETSSENSSETDRISIQKSAVTLIVKNGPITGALFIFGEILVITDKEGIAVSLSCERNEVYFKEKSVLCREDTEFLPQEGSKVLLFLPYGLKESSVSVATLVYVLDDEESSLVDGCHDWVGDFVVDYFIPKLKLRYPNYINCSCDFGFSFSSLSESLNKEFPDLIRDFREVFTYNGNTEKNFLAALKLHLQNSRINKKKWVSFQTSIFSSIHSKIEYSHPKMSKKSIKCRSDMIKRLDAVSGTNNENNLSLKLPSISVKEVQIENTVSSSSQPIEENMLSASTPEVNSSTPSPTSLSSYVSCDTVSDDDFFSLESTSSKSSLNQDAMSKFIASQSKEAPVAETNNADKVKSISVKRKSKKVLTYKLTKQLKNLLSKNDFCQCQYKTVESTAVISMVTDKCFFLDVKDNEDVALSFPMCLIPEEIQNEIKLNSELQISFALHQLVQVSQILHLEFNLNYMPFGIIFHR